MVNKRLITNVFVFLIFLAIILFSIIYFRDNSLIQYLIIILVISLCGIIYNVFHKDLAIKSLKGVNYFALKVPRYYIVIMSLIPLLFIIGGVIILNQGNMTQGTISLIAGALFVLIIFKAFNDISVDKEKIIIRKTLLPIKKEITIKDVKKASFSKQPVYLTWTTFVLELETQQGKKYLDIRTNYNSKDTTRFLQVLKNILGKRFVK